MGGHIADEVLVHRRPARAHSSPSGATMQRPRAPLRARPRTREGGYNATRHLRRSRSHGASSTSPASPGTATRSRAAQDYETGARPRRALPLDPQLVVEGDWEEQSGLTATEAAAARPGPPSPPSSAGNDQMAFGAAPHSCSGTACRSPRDVSIVGFDDQPSAAFTLAAADQRSASPRWRWASRPPRRSLDELRGRRFRAGPCSTPASCCARRRRLRLAGARQAGGRKPAAQAKHSAAVRVDDPAVPARAVLRDARAGSRSRPRRSRSAASSRGPTRSCRGATRRSSPAERHPGVDGPARRPGGGRAGSWTPLRRRTRPSGPGRRTSSRRSR